MNSIVIIGAGMAGARACINLRANGYTEAITLLGDEYLLPYDRPPLSKASITQEDEPQPVWLMDETIARELKVDVRKGIAATGIDPREKVVALSDGSSVSYDKLLIATGAKPRTLPIPGIEHALTLRNHEDSLALRQRFVAGRNIVVIGGGFIGLELASSAAKRGCHVTLIEAQPRILMRGVPEAIAAIVHARHEKAGVTVLTGVGLSHLSQDAVHLADGRVLPADTIISGVGAVPETTLAASAGLAIDNGIACDQHMRTSAPDIYAAGDCASFLHARLANRRIRLEAWRSAQDQAATAVENMLGGAKEHITVPWFWSDQYELGLQIAGFAEMGPVTVARKPNEDTLILFHLAEDGTLAGASGIGPGNAIARDIKLAEMMIAKGIKPPADVLADPGQQLRPLIKG
ncbi:NAD(P)/FAD-dependent oxidoreductase [Taklimakanibacter lacteus]|uniref:NAD(P)/FAD-dependent oxidoreductase n=1 Tax=Taklimakanibacter lacteus TaxID=2268456 RepID=UPI000E66D832